MKIFYIKGLTTSEKEIETIINKFNEYGLEVIPTIKTYKNKTYQMICCEILNTVMNNTVDGEEICFICHSIGCNIGLLNKNNYDVRDMIYISPEFVNTNKNEQEEIVTNYPSQNISESKENSVSLTESFLFLKTKGEIKRILPTVSFSKNDLIIYSKGDKYVNQFWLERELKDEANVFGIDSADHNPLLTSNEPYKLILEHLNKSDERIPKL